MPTATVATKSASVKRSRQTAIRCYWNTLKDVCPNGYIPVAIYYRMSDDKQDTSIDTQRSELIPWMERNKLCPMIEYIDEGISGDGMIHKRKAFLKMIADVEFGVFEAVVCWDQDRFGRFDMIDAGRWIYPLREAGISLRTLAQGTQSWDTLASRLTYAVQQEGKHQFVKDISRNATRGKIATAKQGLWVGGNPPLGYKVERTIDPKGGKVRPGKLANSDDNTENKMVMEIFDLYDSGRSLRGIAEKLNNDYGTHPRTSEAWSCSTVRGILINPTYTGDFVFPHRTYGRYHCVRDGEVSDKIGGTGEQIIIRNNHPAIIDRELFGRIASKIAINKTKTTPHVNGGSFLLSGLVHCAACGNKMSATTITSTQNGKHYSHIYYICSSFRNNGLCKRNSVREEELAAEVIDTIESWATNPTNRASVLDNLAYLRESTTPSESSAGLEDRKVEINKQLETAKRRILIVDDDLVSTVENLVKELKAELVQISKKLAILETPETVVAATQENQLDKIIRSMLGLRGLIDTDRIKAKSLLADLVHKIDVTFEEEKVGKRFRYRLTKGIVHINQAVIDTISPTAEPNSVKVDCGRLHHQTSLRNAMSIIFEKNAVLKGRSEPGAEL